MARKELEHKEHKEFTKTLCKKSFVPFVKNFVFFVSLHKKKSRASGTFGS